MELDAYTDEQTLNQHQIRFGMRQNQRHQHLTKKELSIISESREKSTTAESRRKKIYAKTKKKNF